jgi:hypothetical protein
MWMLTDGVPFVLLGAMLGMFVAASSVGNPGRFGRTKRIRAASSIRIQSSDDDGRI